MLRPGGRLTIYDFRFVRLGPLTAVLSRLGQGRRSALRPLSLYAEIQAVGPD